MNKSAHRRILAGRIACGVLTLFGPLGISRAEAQDAAAKYAHMAPIEQYLMDRAAEITLARSAAPEAISKNATILVLGRHGYETAVQGKNGFVCMVARGWVGAFDWPEFWNPKTRGAECLNPAAVRSVLPLAEMRTRLLLGGAGTREVVDSLRAALNSRAVPPLESGAMSYMMSKDSYLTDAGSHNGSHVMFYASVADAAAWGAGAPGSPVGFGPYWFFSEGMRQRYKDLPVINVFTVGVAKWSDGTPAVGAHQH